MTDCESSGTENSGGQNVEYMPVRYLNEYVYCPRLGYLEWVEAEFQDNYYTLDGSLKHRRVDEESDSRKHEPEVLEEGAKIHQRAVHLASDTLRLTGRVDVLESDGEALSPVEYKRGKVPDAPDNSYEPERVQVCAYGLLLRENGHVCDRGYVYYIDSKRRVEIQFDEPLVESTLGFIERFRETSINGVLPPPLEDSPKCHGCSLVGVCLPDETNFLSCPGGSEPDKVRRLVPARDDALAVYVSEQGTFVGKEGDLLVFKSRGPGRDKVDEVRLMDVSQLCIFGNVQVSTQALRELCSRGISTCYFSYGGWFYGMTQGHFHKNVALRIAQYTTFTDVEKSLDIARQMVTGKIKNARTIIRRNHPEKPAGVLRDLAVLSNKAKRANSAAELLGIEGSAARAYYQVFSELFKRSKSGLPFDFNGRNRRPPRDPVNAMLSFVYSMLVKDLTVTLQSVGLDPYLGVFHRPKYGKPALALDLAEEFRPLVGDSVVLGLVNNQEVTRSDFIERMGSVAMSKGARSKLICAYERRMDTLIRHPLFGYTVSYRRVMEVQARLLGRFFTGEIPEYRTFCTR